MSVSIVWVASLATATLLAILVWIAFPAHRSLGSRLHPYLAPSQSMGRSSSSGGPIGEIFGPMTRSVAEWVGRLLDRSGDGVTPVNLRQAGWYRGLDEQAMVNAYRMAQLRSIAVGVVIALCAGLVIGSSWVMTAGLVFLGLVVGGSRQRSRVNRAISDRTERMRIEIYTIDQLLAMRVRAGGGLVHAVSEMTDRGNGEVVVELRDALRLHRAGWRAGDAFRRIAELTPEPFCGRTYRLLASAEERGADLAPALLDLAEDVRETRRESIRRSATKRRAAMLIPTIAILAPVLILFVAAPLPYLITGWR
jgi:tight adherence protein C